ncbi:hypothetical protein L1987_39316 [Smallanthus sonchifolius]|uniref:Uncharacterized protein n=1 Tax=Smallanthus sonchifolius TaxID=185202 RepID=A0ACB9HMU3_9ASTR|nr:hypothetical protein L1987_39316 [Smallanthus sonchifolius]
MAPSFYKILLHPSAPHLQIPPDFVSMHLDNKIPNGPVIVFANGGYSWSMKIKRIGDGYCFADGWKNVVEDIPLDFGDFLYFELVDPSTFKMSLYSPDGCQMFVPPKVEHDGGGDDEEDDDEDDDDDDDDDPFFTLVITKTHKNLLRLPPGFVGLTGIAAKGTMTMKNADGNEWSLGLRVDKWCNRHYLSYGWREFKRENDLCDGDECVFKFIRSEGKLLLANVTKK